MDDLREDFIAETRDTLEILAEQLVQWEKSPDDISLIDSVFRFVHTVKGSCGFLDLPRLLKLSHAAEEVLSAARDGLLLPSPDLVTAVLNVIDRIAELTDALETGAAVSDTDSGLIDAMLAFLPNSQSLPAAAFDANIPLAETDLPGEADDYHLRQKGRTVRVSLSLLDKLMNGISDLVLARNEVSRQLRSTNDVSGVDGAFGRLSSSVAEMRDAIGQMRLQSIDRLFSTLPRALRDICIELDKQIDLVVEGNDVEIDREMAEAMRDPLTHILRNAADHGIETASERIAAGKPITGKIKVVARQSGNQILVEISDDGRGVDLERLASKAIERKLFTSAQWHKMPEQAKLESIFHPGLSTASAVSAISGRGVGMDVVQNNIHAIGGSIDLENFEGRGLKITLRLPLTLSIIAGISVSAGGQCFGISRSSIVEILSMKNQNLVLEDIGGMRVAKVRNQRYACAVLEDVLGVQRSSADSDCSRTLIVIKPAVGATFALDVESVVDNEELVVKPGAPLIMAAGLFAGTTLPDNGRPMLLLDASGLAEAIGAQQELIGVNDESETAVLNSQSKQGDSALLFECTDGIVRAIRLAVVERMEELSATQIHEIGGRCCVSIDESIFALYGSSSESHSASDIVKMLRISDGDRVIYLQVNDVLDILTIPASAMASAEPWRVECLLKIEGKPVELLNPFQFFEMEPASSATSAQKPLCYIATDAGADAIWETRILQPLLQASGYTVSYDEADRQRAAVILSTACEQPESDRRTVALRSSVQPITGTNASIYRYDRVAILAAIESKIAGVM